MKAGILVLAVAAFLPAWQGCVHIEVFHPDVQGTYHLGADRPFWAYEGAPRRVALAQRVTPVAQETPTWCWAASCQMLLASQGVALSQSQIVRRAYGDTRQAGGKSPLMVQALTGTFTTESGKPMKLEAHRADGFPHNGLELVSSIEDGMPFIVDIGYFKEARGRGETAFAAHSLLVVGITYRREGNQVHVMSLNVLDPSYAMVQEKVPQYAAEQVLEEKDFSTIQGTVGIYRK